MTSVPSTLDPFDPMPERLNAPFIREPNAAAQPDASSVGGTRLGTLQEMIVPQGEEPLYTSTGHAHSSQISTSSIVSLERPGRYPFHSLDVTTTSS